MKLVSIVAVSAVLVTLCGCSTILSGTSQKITVNTDPPGADCELTRDGLTIGRVNPTPGVTEVSTNRSAITVACKKEGYTDSSDVNKAGFDPATLGNILLGGLVGFVVDASSGAASKYDSVINIQLQSTSPGSASSQSPEPGPSASAGSSSPITQ
jgi:hypothetical protein